jgi:hypothetical protein
LTQVISFSPPTELFYQGEVAYDLAAHCVSTRPCPESIYSSDDIGERKRKESSAWFQQIPLISFQGQDVMRFFIHDSSGDIPLATHNGDKQYIF